MTVKLRDRRLDQLVKQHADAKAAALAFLDANEGADGTLPEDKQAAYDELKAKIIQAQSRVQVYQERLALEADSPPAYDDQREEDTGPSHIKVKPPGFVKDPRKGFESHTEFLSGVIRSTKAGRIEDPRLRFLVSDSNGKAIHQIGTDGQVLDMAGRAVKITAGTDEQSTFSNPYGGFFVPEAFTPGPKMMMPEADPIGSRVTPIPMTAPIVKINARIDKDHSTSVSGGLRFYRRAESDTASSSRMQFEQVRLEAHSLYGLAYATNELLASSPVSFAALLAAGFQSELPNKLIDERLNGSGVGEFEGVANALCRIEVAKENNQAADSIVYENLVKMRSRCWNYQNAVWLYNHDCLPQLMTMVLEIGTGGVPMWQMSAREGEPDMLLGRPAYPSEYLKTVGDSGDIVLAVWSEYLEGVYMPYETAESMHVRFLENETTFRVTMMNAGAHWWRSALRPKNTATNTLSPVVYLAARA
jgi:HK97 family phage major capsid protein